MFVCCRCTVRRGNANANAIDDTVTESVVAFEVVCFVVDVVGRHACGERSRGGGDESE